jgi:imidazolonepropionase-like amidohydrolase
MLPDLIVRLRQKTIMLEPGRRTVLNNVRLIDGTGRSPREGASLVINGDRIEGIEERPVSGVDQAHIVDGGGRTVIPGMIDCHIHFTGHRTHNPVELNSPDQWDFYRQIVALIDVGLALDAGFTTVRCLGHGPAEQVYGLKRAVAEGLLLGPRILSSGWAISQTAGHGDPHTLPQSVLEWHKPRSAFADGPLECRKLVRLNLGSGADCIKIYTSEGSPAWSTKR